MRTLRFLLLISLLAPPAGALPLRAIAPVDCPLCGHACCCPEKCKPLIEAAKKKAACRAAETHCHLQNQSDEISMAGFDSEAKAAPTRWTSSTLNLIKSCFPSTIHESHLVYSFSAERDVPTPPPRVRLLS